MMMIGQSVDPNARTLEIRGRARRFIEVSTRDQGIQVLLRERDNKLVSCGSEGGIGDGFEC